MTSRILAVVLAVLVLPTAALAGDVRPERPVEIPLRPYVKLLKTVDVEVGGRTLPFIFDTGGGTTLITPEVAKSLGCEPYGRATGYRMSGERVDFRYCDDVTLAVAKLDLGHDRIGVLDLMELLPDGLPELGGLIALDSFPGQALEVDLTGERLVVHSTKSFKKGKLEGRRLDSRVATGVNGGEYLLFVKAETPRGPLWMQFDTGNVGDVLLAPPAAEMLDLGVDFENEAAAAGVAPADHSVEVGCVLHEIPGLGEVRATTTVREMIHDGMLNANLIAGRRYLLDLEHGQIWALPPTGEDGHE